MPAKRPQFSLTVHLLARIPCRGTIYCAPTCPGRSLGSPLLNCARCLNPVHATYINNKPPAANMPWFPLAETAHLSPSAGASFFGINFDVGWPSVTKKTSYAMRPTCVGSVSLGSTAALYRNTLPYWSSFLLNV